MQLESILITKINKLIEKHPELVLEPYEEGRGFKFLYMEGQGIVLDLVTPYYDQLYQQIGHYYKPVGNVRFRDVYLKRLMEDNYERGRII